MTPAQRRAQMVDEEFGCLFFAPKTLIKFRIMKLIQREAARERARVRRIINHKNNTKWNTTTITGDQRIIFLNGYNKACIDILLALKKGTP